MPCRAMPCRDVPCLVRGHFGPRPKILSGCKAPPAMARYEKENEYAGMTRKRDQVRSRSRETAKAQPFVGWRPRCACYRS
eukprot:10435160-Lingulodinium_polyedra.AAC.1